MRGPFDFEEEFERRPDWREWLSRLGGWTGGLIALAVVGIWLATGFYTIGPAEVGLVKRFGKFVGTAGPGFHYRLPAPIESVAVVDQQSVRTEEIGFRSQRGVPSTQFPVREEEALMLTGDFNIIRVETVIQYDVTQPKAFAFEVEDHRTVIREAAQAAIREQIAQHSVDEALTTARQVIAGVIHDELQKLLDRYGTGMRILNVRLQEVTPPTPEVAAAFDDVNSAIQDKERTILEAQRYANEQIPRAKGQAQKILNQAEAYKETRVLGAQGDVARFLRMLEPYRTGQRVTEARLYIETMEEILPSLNKVILPGEAGGLLSLLNIEQLMPMVMGQGGEER